MDRIICALLLSLSSVAGAQAPDLTLLPRTNERLVQTEGRNAVLHYEENAAGSLIALELTSALRLPELVEPQPDTTATLLIRRSPSGDVLSHQKVQLEGIDMRSMVHPLPDGGLLIAGTTTSPFHSSTPARISFVRLDAAGRTLWQTQGEQRFPARCDPTERMCSFIDVQQMILRDGRAWIAGVVQRGRFVLPGTSLRIRRGLASFLLELDLDTGRARWATRGYADSAADGTLITVQASRTETSRVTRSMDSGEVMRRQTLEGSTPIRRGATLGDESAAIIESPTDDRRCALVIWDASGAEIHRRASGCNTVLLTYRGAFILADAQIEGVPDGDHTHYLTRGVRISRVDTRGIETLIAQHDGFYHSGITLTPSGFFAGVLRRPGEALIVVRRANVASHESYDAVFRPSPPASTTHTISLEAFGQLPPELRARIMGSTAPMVPATTQTNERMGF